MKFKLLILLLFYSTLFFSQEDSISIYKELKNFYSEAKDQQTIFDILNKYKEDKFYKEENQKIYKKLGTQVLWNHFALKPSKKKIENKYLTISNAYLPYGKIYLKKGNKIDSLYRVSNNKHFPHKNIFYRNPVWKIPVDSILQTDVFLKVKNSSGRTRMALYLESENEFLKRIETEYFYFGLFIAFLISMTLVLVFFAVLKKEYTVLFYALYIITVLFEFLAGKGLGVQYFWSDSSFFTNNIRSFSQTVGVFCIGFFYMKFYKLKTSQIFAKGIFKWGTFLTIPILLLYVYKYFFGGFVNLYLVVWTVLKIIIFTWVLNHLYLTIKKQLPIYLVVAFILPILSVIIGQIMNPSVNNSLGIKFSGPNIYYLTLSLEILLFTRYIFDSVIDTQIKYFKLKKVSDELKYNFQSKTLEVQQQERNKLVNNVHDTFGGYLEALKLRLLQKTENTPEKVQEILDAFYKDYRYLLNSLYAPKINSANFTTSLIEFCEKLDELTSQKINYAFNIDDIDLQQEKCVHLYRIISELTTNAIKYSEATEITILMKQKTEEFVFLQVSDNGIGFKQDKISKTGFGLNSVKDRVEQINGSLEIISNKEGTLFKIEVPVNEH
ncbi:MAG: ATP-binding protein [Polaribacter sp.]|uniref:sensor histidine kinase n=1 Tax=Polaribacter sp. TaxID=1920175 RepID=UPI002F35CEBD